MSAYFKQKKGWRYDFRIQGQRYTGAWFPTKRAALDAEAERRKKPREEQGEQPAVATLQAVPVPPGGEPIPPIQTVTDFLTLTNARLDSIRSRRRERHYKEVCRCAKDWIREWGSLPCTEVTTRMIETFVDRIAQSSTCVANRNLLLLSAVFRYGIKKGLLRENPAAGIERYPEKEADVYVPPTEDVERVLRVAAPEQRDYLEVMWGTLGRMGEINRLEWADVDFATGG